MLKTIYEDNDIIVLMKRAGQAVQTRSLTQPDMISELRTYLKGGYVGIVHRLDQPVSGLIVFAKNKSAAASLSKQFSDDSIHKEYSAIVYSSAALSEDKTYSLTDYLLKDSNASKALVVSEDTAGAKRAELTYRVCRCLTKNVYELKITLITGRFHQIRAQLSHAGLSILGDEKYNGPSVSEYVKAGILKPLPKGAIALEAKTLQFTHPATKKQLLFSL